MGLPAIRQRDVCIGRLKTSLVWQQLPPEELQKECDTWGIVPTFRGDDWRQLANAAWGDPQCPRGPCQNDSQSQSQQDSRNRSHQQPHAQQQNHSGGCGAMQRSNEVSAVISKHLSTLNLPPCATVTDVKRA